MEEKKHILFEVHEKIGIATFNRPEKGNAFDWTTIKEMEEILYRVEHDEGIRGMILTAKGNEYFCVGADINLMKSIEGKEYAEFLLAGLRMNEKLQRSRKPTIAAINGWAVGAGGEIAMSCDLRIASTNAKIGVPELKIGLIPGWGGIFRLTRLVGQTKALEMVLTASNIPAKEAKEIGLINKVVEPEKLINEAKAMMGKILQNAPIAISLAKYIIRSEAEIPFYIGENYEAMVSILTFLTRDGKEGMEAFFEKREPSWAGT
ncbi:MAG: enoyl-CoA hydratase/isomerase family protein [Deltaproteobacteria bacterium]|nr:enoyl-CoA hydratase/isomerase family protein [Deltaproteobacteria bacterium]